MSFRVFAICPLNLIRSRAPQHRFQTETFQAEVKRSQFNIELVEPWKEKNDSCYENGTFSYRPRSCLRKQINGWVGNQTITRTQVAIA